MTELAALIGDLQTLSRSDEDQSGDRIQVVDLQETVEAALHRARLRGPELTITADLQPWFVRQSRAAGAGDREHPRQRGEVQPRGRGHRGHPQGRRTDRPRPRPRHPLRGTPARRPLLALPRPPAHCRARAWACRSWPGPCSSPAARCPSNRRRAAERWRRYGCRARPRRPRGSVGPPPPQAPAGPPTTPGAARPVPHRTGARSRPLHARQFEGYETVLTRGRPRGPRTGVRRGRAARPGTDGRHHARPRRAGRDAPDRSVRVRRPHSHDHRPGRGRRRCRRPRQRRRRLPHEALRRRGTPRPGQGPAAPRPAAEPVRPSRRPARLADLAMDRPTRTVTRRDRPKTG